jgi:hypothetical protein
MVAYAISVAYAADGRSNMHLTVERGGCANTDTRLEIRLLGFTVSFYSTYALQLFLIRYLLIIFPRLFNVFRAIHVHPVIKATRDVIVRDCHFYTGTSKAATSCTLTTTTAS